jgi:hypothetical protein
MSTLEQKIAQKEAELSRLREKSQKLANSQKIIIGGMLIRAAKQDPKIREWLIEEAAKYVTRDADKKRLAPLLDELAASQQQSSA